MRCVQLFFLIGTALAPLRGAAEPVPPRLPTENRPLAERFANPPASARFLPILHAQPDDPTVQDERLRELAARGFGGFAGNVSFDGYVDDETKWPAFLRGVRLAKQAGMALWLYDECGYPSGSARDLTLQGHPEWAARGLLVNHVLATEGAVTLDVPPGELVLAAALPQRDGVVVLEDAVEITGAVQGNRLRWQAPAGTWFVVVMTDDLIYEGTHAAISLAYKKPCIDLLTPEPTRRFLEVTHARYAEKLGDNLGQYFVATFTDEPSLQNYWFRPMPYRVLPWSRTLEDEFAKRRGRPLRPLLPALVVDAGPVGGRVRYAFWQTVGELVSENYFGQIQSWCHQHHLRSGGHLLMEESLVGHVPFYGHFFQCVRRLDAPSMDCLTSLPQQVPWQVARLIGSVADLTGNDVTMCEVSDHSQRYRPPGDKRAVRVVTEDEIRGTCHRLIWGGINTLTSYYAFDGLTTEQLRRLNQQLGRCQTMLRGGHQVSEIAVLYPIESVWTRFVPAHHGATDATDARRVESVFDRVGSALYAANRDFCYIDAQALLDATATDGVLRHGELEWRILVLPAVDTLPLAAWERIVAFYRQGGVVIAAGTRPANSDSQFPSPRVQAFARELLGTGSQPAVATNGRGGCAIYVPSGMSGLVPRIVDSLLDRDAYAADSHAAIKITRREIDEHQIYFVINDGDTAWAGEIHLGATGVVELWDPVDGSVKLLHETTRVPVQLMPYGALLLRTTTVNTPTRTSIDGEEMFKVASQPLPEARQVSLGHGEFVRAQLAGNAAEGWSATGELSKGQTDTFLFVNFRYGPTLNLTGSDGLQIPISVPAGQNASAELLVFLHTSMDNRFVAHTGRFLNEAGANTAYVTFDQFAPFGETTGKLDVSDVRAIGVGWGGYYGVAGESVDFSLHLPQRFIYGAP